MELTRKDKNVKNGQQLAIWSAIAESNKSEAISMYRFIYDIGLLNPTYMILLRLMYLIELYQKQAKKNNGFNDDNFVNTSELKIGMIVKDYKGMCSILHEELRTGKSRQLQIENWKRYFDFEKVLHGNTYIILDIYDEPIEKEERTYRNALFVNHLKVMILDIIASYDTCDNQNDFIVTNKSITYFTTYPQLMKKIFYSSHFDSENILNKRFDFENAIDVIEDNTSHERNDIARNLKLYRNIIQTKIRDSIEYAINTLEKENMIKSKVYNVIATKNREGKVIYHKANNDEESIISQSKKEVSKKSGYNNSYKASMNDINFYNKLNKYYKENYGWEYVFTRLEIIVNKDNLKTNINNYTAFDIQNSVIDLNGNDLIRIKNEYHSNIITNSHDTLSKLKDKNNTRLIQSIKEQLDMDEDTIKCIYKPYDFENISGINDDIISEIDNNFV